MSSLTDKNELIRREAALAAQLIGSGLTSIRRYDFAFKGVFYAGMFSASIGFERLLKLIIILKQKIDSGEYPDNNVLRKSGHNLNKLIEQCMCENEEATKEIKESDYWSQYHNVLEDELVVKIASFMTEFANKTRYYNLDVLTGSASNDNEPLAEWDKRICSVIVDRHPPSKRKVAEFKAMANLLRNNLQVIHTHEDGSHVGDVETFMYNSMLVGYKQSYSTYYIYKLIYSFVRMLIELDFGLKQQLYLREYFEHLHCASHTPSAIRRRKVWV